MTFLQYSGNWRGAPSRRGGTHYYHAARPSRPPSGPHRSWVRPKEGEAAAAVDPETGTAASVGAASRKRPRTTTWRRTQQEPPAQGSGVAAAAALPLSANKQEESTRNEPSVSDAPPQPMESTKNIRQIRMGLDDSEAIEMAASQVPPPSSAQSAPSAWETVARNKLVNRRAATQSSKTKEDTSSEPAFVSEASTLSSSTMDGGVPFVGMKKVARNKLVKAAPTASTADTVKEQTLSLSDATPSTTTVGWKKVARNKLVKAAPAASNANSLGAENISDATTPSSSTVGMKKVARNKLVKATPAAPTAEPLGIETAVAAANSAINEEGAVSNRASLKKVAPNKLVKPSEHAKAPSVRPETWNRPRPSRLHPKQQRQSAKRIKLSENNLHNDDETNEDGDEQGKKKVLTDFAYQGGKRSLVRVANEQTARICPTFLRGAICSKPTCLDRHDVPASRAQPVCVFFQRQGMCLREDCPFAHVKVRAMDCPAFTARGFCEDTECPWMHRKSRRKESGKNGR